jgi:hypothetical protein
LKVTEDQYLFGAETDADQTDRERQVSLILTSLEEASRSDRPVTVGISAEGVSLMTWLMDLGAAPGQFPVSRTLRLLGTGRPSIMLMLNPNIAGEMRALIEKGAFRHRAGATDPTSLRIH